MSKITSNVSDLVIATHASMADKVPESVPSCRCCGASLSVMKRCVQCQDAFYCSRTCQMKDWTNHKSHCMKKIRREDGLQTASYVQDNKCIFPEESDQKPDEIDTDLLQQKSTAGGKDTKRPAVNFQAAFDELKHSSDKRCSEEDSGRSYLHNNTFYFDVLAFEIDKPFSEITVKSNKEKLKLQIQHDWGGDAIYKIFSCKLHIPLEKLKIIHKGKIMSQTSINDFITDKAVFQVVGEKSSDERGIDKTDIDIMMSQLNVDRNIAVLALQKKGDLIDAILEAANKE